MNRFDIVEFLGLVAMIFVPMLFSLCFHEFAHAFVAKIRGDNTAQMMGRLSLNPLVHMDVIGTFALPLLSLATGITWIFGWAKPVPVNSRNLKNPRADMFWIALAGPLSNVFLALVGALALWGATQVLATTEYFRATALFLQYFMATNLSLAFFNLIPLHPLDGGKVMARFLPASLNYKLEQNEAVMSLVLFALLLSGVMVKMWQPGMPLYYIYKSLQDWALG